VHRNGYGVAGVYTYELAETKVNRTRQLAKEAEFPLKLTMEPEEL
jgi:ATP-dependent Clp protease adaptor protein ClpS